jgi:hypothetical protein
MKILEIQLLLLINAFLEWIGAIFLDFQFLVWLKFTDENSLNLIMLALQVEITLCIPTHQRLSNGTNNTYGNPMIW